MDWFFYWMIYAFLGYICEVFYVSIMNKRLTNRGYLYGPICPIYGYGALIVIALLKPLYDLNMWYLVLLLGILLTTLLEYLTSVVMELLFHMRWWDYSNRKFNIKGRVCLRNSLLFGLLVMVVLYLIHPTVLKCLDLITNDAVRYTLFFTLLILYILDTVFSTLRHIKAIKIVDKIKDALNDKFQIPREKFIEILSNNKIVNFLRKYTINYGVMVKTDKSKNRIKLKEAIRKIIDTKEVNKKEDHE